MMRPIKQAPKSSYMLRQHDGRGVLCVREHQEQRHVQYILGFDDLDNAVLVRNAKANPRKLRIHRSPCKDLRDGNLQTLHTLPDSPTVAETGHNEKIKLWGKTALIIPKYSNGSADDDDDRRVDIDRIPTHDLYTIPFERNIGLVLPYRLLHKSRRELVFECSVIESWGDNAYFRMALDICIASTSH